MQTTSLINFAPVGPGPRSPLQLTSNEHTASALVSISYPITVSEALVTLGVVEFVFPW
jgi:hypothetical protein